jgi:hypothetical protein
MESAPHLDKAYTQDLHHRLLDGDPTAPHAVMKCMYEPLVHRLARANPMIWRIDASLVIDVVVDALRSYIKRPRQFRPERGNLFDYLTMSAQGDLRNALARLRREQARVIPFDPVVHDRAAGNIETEGLTEGELAAEYRALREAVQHVRQKLQNDCERKVLDLILDEERRTSVFARALGIQHMPPAQQQREVKRVKDRIKRRIIRRYTALLGKTAKR